MCHLLSPGSQPHSPIIVLQSKAIEPMGFFPPKIHTESHLGRFSRYCHSKKSVLVAYITEKKENQTPTYSSMEIGHHHLIWPNVEGFLGEPCQVSERSEPITLAGKLGEAKGLHSEIKLLCHLIFT